jgi:hypothetical protein
MVGENRLLEIASGADRYRYQNQSIINGITRDGNMLIAGCLQVDKLARNDLQFLPSHRHDGFADAARSLFTECTGVISLFFRCEIFILSAHTQHNKLRPTS